MEYNFADTCRQISRHFADLADAYEKDKNIIKVRLDLHDREIVNNIVTVCKDTKNYEDYRVVNISEGTIWATIFKTKADAIKAIEEFRSPSLIEINRVYLIKEGKE